MSSIKRIPLFITYLVCLPVFSMGPEPLKTARTPRVRTVDLNIGESQQITLCDGSQADVKLLALDERCDDIRGAVREARVQVDVNGISVQLISATYHLPETAGSVQIDCPITRGYTKNSRSDAWGLEKDARLRLWPAGSPLVAPGTFVYPLRQRWFASDTQMANDPTFVDGGEMPGSTQIYYHYGLDFGGVEGMVDIIAATSGIVVSSGTDVLPGYKDTPVNPRYDVVYLLDGRGWYYRYSHLKSIENDIRPGKVVPMGKKIGVLGKEGGSGGWSHLHFDISSRQPSGKWGTQEGYAFVWEAYMNQYRPDLIAIARPHHIAWTGEQVKLDGSRSWSRDGKELSFQWTFTDGRHVTGAIAKRVYEKPGEYSEILKITDAAGRVDYDFAVVQVFDKSSPRRIPAIHPAYSPTFGIRPGDPVTFTVRSFGTPGGEVLDFGDGTPPVEVKSDGNANVHAANGYAVTTHRFAKAGDYIVRAEYTGEQGVKAIAHLHVTVENASE